MLWWNDKVKEAMNEDYNHLKKIAEKIGMKYVVKYM